jgi:hypothetical protein
MINWEGKAKVDVIFGTFDKFRRYSNSKKCGIEGLLLSTLEAFTRDVYFKSVNHDLKQHVS